MLNDEKNITVRHFQYNVYCKQASPAQLSDTNRETKGLKNEKS